MNIINWMTFITVWTTLDSQSSGGWSICEWIIVGAIGLFYGVVSWKVFKH